MKHIIGDNIDSFILFCKEYKIEDDPAITLDSTLTQSTFGSLRRIPLTPESINKYKNSNNMLIHTQIHSDIKGFLFINSSNKCCAYIGVNMKSSYIVALWVDPKYRNKGYGSKLLNISRKILNAKYLSVNKKNISAINLYKQEGWTKFHQTDKMYFYRYN